MLKPPGSSLASSPAQTLSKDALAPLGPAPRIPLAQLGRVADLAGLNQVLSRELSAARRVGTRPALVLIEVAVRASHDKPLLPDAQTNRAQEPQQQNLTERLMELMGARLRSRVRAADVALRVGAQGLAVVLQNVERANVLAIQQRLNKTLSGAYELDGLSLHAVLTLASVKCEGPRVNAADMIDAAEQVLQTREVEARWPGADGRRSLDLRMPAPAALGLGGYAGAGFSVS